MTNFGYLVPQQQPRDVSVWATVTAIAPLRIRIDGDAAPLLITPDTLVAGLAVNDRVWVALATNDDPVFTGRRAVVLGKSGGTGQAEPFAILRRVAAQPLANDTNIPVSWDTAIRDPFGGWDDENPTGYTLPLSGAYTLSGLASWSANATNRRAVHLLLNGANVDGTQIIATAQAVSTTSLFYSAPLIGNAGQLAGVNLWHNAGTGLNTGTGLTAVTVTIEYKGP